MVPAQLRVGDYIELVAVFGLILLLFNLGLEFDQDEFFGNFGKLLISGGTYIVINMGVGFAFGIVGRLGHARGADHRRDDGTSSSAIVTKLLIELRRLANTETPMILGITVVEDIFIAIYLAIVSVIIERRDRHLADRRQAGIAFTFLVVMFALARWGGRFVSRLVRTKDDELFTILFFGLAVPSRGIGEMLGVSDAIGAFLIGLVLGATRFRNRIEHSPRRCATSSPRSSSSTSVSRSTSRVRQVLGPGRRRGRHDDHGQHRRRAVHRVAEQARVRRGINASAMLQNRGEFALILATLSLQRGTRPAHPARSPASTC